MSRGNMPRLKETRDKRRIKKTRKKVYKLERLERPRENLKLRTNNLND
jgi:hypothetical protein